ncbi:hypothetical protein BGX27_000083 [Mortierella sp. AM989]|nr:hypothetical protein BGX27_000083 [Mortierella sp. AM989]
MTFSHLSPRSNNPALTQTISHTVQDDYLSFDVPVSVDIFGNLSVMLQPIFDVFPETVALCRRDKSQLPFLSSSDGVL